MMKKELKRSLILSKIKENFIYQLLLCVVLCSIIIIGYFIMSKVIDNRKFREYNIVKDINLVNSIEDIKIVENKVTLSGYAFMVNKSSSDSTISMFLVNRSNEQEIWLDMEQINRLDVNMYYENEYNYANSGFLATTKVDKLNKNDVYEAFINIDYKDANDTLGSKSIRKTVSTNFYLLNNELYTYNPNEFDMPDMNVESNLLKDVFASGDLYFYQKDIGMYVYEYQGEIYWITYDDYEFKGTNIIYQLHTTQTDKLPEHRIQHKFDNLDFYFENLEYKNEVTTPYRVAIYDVPKEYPITYIRTGEYDAENGNWIWSKDFHLNNIISNQ